MPSTACSWEWSRLPAAREGSRRSARGSVPSTYESTTSGWMYARRHVAGVFPRRLATDSTARARFRFASRPDENGSSAFRA